MSLAYLKAERRQKKEQFDLYVKRRNSIRSIISNIDSSFDDDVRDINLQISNCISELVAGLKGSGSTKTICTNMEECKQKYSESDAKISSSRGNLSNEVSRCQERINSLDLEIRSLERQIENENRRIYFGE